MPELPEVETVRRGLERLIVGKKILTVEVLNDKSMPIPRDAIDNIVVGTTIQGVRRRAKAFMIDLDNDFSLVGHLKMTGQMVYRGKENWGGGHPNSSLLAKLPDRSTRVVIKFIDGQLFFNDQRKFGWIKLFKTSEVPNIPFIAKLGPEPLLGNPEPDFLARIARRRNTTIKAAILDQTVLAGVGSIYADESLWLARIHPASRVGNLSQSDLKNILGAVQKVMTDSLAVGGSTFRDYVQADGQRGDYLDKLANVYGRAGQPCHNCGSLIKKTKISGRGTHFCPTCQVLK